MGCCSGGTCSCKTESPKNLNQKSVLIKNYTHGGAQLDTFNWLDGYSSLTLATDIVEIRFKNTRKEFYYNTEKLKLEKNDRVIVEGNPGHDVGTVSLVGELALKQFEKKVKNPATYGKRLIYRIARENDLEKWAEAKKLEWPTMIKARQIAKSLLLDMKISDVEYQGDGRKAIFYYIAEERVDFRELIKLYAQEFKVKIEMKQIGVRQESARVGGIGSCGRELCCSTWRTDLSTVSTDAARIQELPLNAQKLAGQCGKLKCCLMYELELYLEAREEFPSILLELDTENGKIYPHKNDILKKLIWYSYDPEKPINTFPIEIAMVKKYINENKKGKLVNLNNSANNQVKHEFTNAAGTDDLLRFTPKKTIKKIIKKPELRN